LYYYGSSRGFQLSLDYMVTTSRCSASSESPAFSNLDAVQTPPSPVQAAKHHMKVRTSRVAQLYSFKPSTQKHKYQGGSPYFS
jgi:hypothetical protein